MCRAIGHVPGREMIDQIGKKEAGRPMWSPRLETFLIRSMVA